MEALKFHQIRYAFIFHPLLYENKRNFAIQQHTVKLLTSGEAHQMNKFLRVFGS